MLLATTFRSATFVAALLVFASAGADRAAAGDATYLAHDASYCEIFRVLSREVPGECRQMAPLTRGLKTRSIRFHAAEQTMAVSAAMVDPTASKVAETADYGGDIAGESGSEELSLAMRIQFQLNSSILTEQAKASLDNVASVLNSEVMAETVLLLEGHADATGTQDYNFALSQRRAQAVQAYLVNEHEIEVWRLPFVGKGETDPYDPNEPTSSINRRVEFTNITG